uniref:Peptidase A1 domain-containing protein n=1 Tax=Chaetoceros debilis TaxID=122233 RepID=A0A7S3PYZ2_9STRA|eukprot:CAMPEP_0194087122 /NCGR_PEP_ID=MMETSP0149-20130528/23899_1 /TAXON_ID=122233 /ORGANISM="Chaetoceros debilis, Strain MM31A-1" /LENGTH=637 /DNA_ID=CAMNT_0038770395 /DNA_START=49 /DNA_END=1962 /DNA_ORIENTATION=+
MTGPKIYFIWITSFTIAVSAATISIEEQHQRTFSDYDDNDNDEVFKDPSMSSLSSLNAMDTASISILPPQLPTITVLPPIKKQITIPMYQGYGAHYVQLDVGSSNPQPQTFLLDTGSASIGVPCNECIDCGSKRSHADFNQNLSRSYQESTCEDCHMGKCDLDTGRCMIETNYLGGCSWSGKEGTDWAVPSFGDGWQQRHKDHNFSPSSITSIGEASSATNRLRTIIGTEENDISEVKSSSSSSSSKSHSTTPFDFDVIRHKFKLDFACMTSTGGQFKTQLSNGIAGMGLSTLSLWMQMYNNRAIDTKQFSMCVSKNLFFGEIAGALTLGGNDERLNQSPMRYMQLHSEDGMHGVGIRKIHVHKSGGETIADMDFTKLDDFEHVKVDSATLNDGGVILDSGTTNTYLSEKLRPALDEAWLEVTGQKFPTEPIKISSAEIKKWPTLVFQMKGPEKSINLDIDRTTSDMKVAFPSSRYMQLNARTKMFEPRFILGEDYGNIIGENFMRGHNVFFDVDNWLVGFADSDCDYKYLETGTPSEKVDPYISRKDLNTLVRSHMCEKNKWICIVLSFIDSLYLIFLLAAAAIVLQSYIETRRKIRILSVESLRNEDGEKDQSKRSTKDWAKLLQKNSFEPCEIC